MSISIEVTGLTEVTDYFEEAADRLAETVGASLEAVVQEIVEFAKSIAPVRTGEYQASIGMEQTGPMSFTVFAAAPHAKFVEYGTAPHIITPKTGRVLHWQEEGEDAFATYVLHPGTAGQWVIHTAKKEYMDKVVEAIREGVREAFNK